jgi:putative salt-induced outer membrane protein YdiY
LDVQVGACFKKLRPEDLIKDPATSDTLITNALAVALEVSTQLALSVGYAVTDNINLRSGLKRVDTLETVNLVYAF